MHAKALLVILMMRLHWKIMFYRRFQWHSSLNWWSIYCYESTFASSEGLKQRCCYNVDWWSDDLSSLLLGPPYGGHVVDYVSCKEYFNKFRIEFDVNVFILSRAWLHKFRFWRLAFRYCCEQIRNWP